MKLLIPVLFLLASVSANASHYITCGVKAKVISIQSMDRLNDSTTVRDSSPIGGENIDESVTIATLKIVEVINGEGMQNCYFDTDQEVTLFVKPDEKKSYKKGNTLNINYKNIGDSLGSNIAWTVK